MTRRHGTLRVAGTFLAAGAAVALAFSLVPASGAAGVPQTGFRTVQVWPDLSAGVVDGRLEGALADPDLPAHPYGVARSSTGGVVRGRTYLSFPLQVFPPGTDVVRATLYAHADCATSSGEAQLGAYRVLMPWESSFSSGDPASWPPLLDSPVATSRGRASGRALGALGVSKAPFGITRPEPSTLSLLPVLTGERPMSGGRAPGLAMPPSQQQTRVLIDPSEVAVDLGDTVQVAVRVDGANGLGRVEFVVEYDPQVLEVIDVDPDTAGVQVHLGPFVDPDGAARNWVALERGEIELAQEVPGAPVSGSGIVAWITFRGRSAGSSSVRFAYLLLEDEDGQDQPVSGQPGRVDVGGGSISAATPSPSATTTAPPTSTLPPDSTGTLAAGPTYTPPASPLATPQPGDPLGRAVVMGRFVGTWVSWDVTALLRAWLSEDAANYGLSIASAPRADASPDVAGDLLLARWYSADDPDTAPHIVVEYQVLPVTPTPTATSPALLPPAGHSNPVQVGGLVVAALAGLVLLGAGLARRQR